MNQDHIFIDVTPSNLGVKAEIIDIAVIRSDRKGAVLKAFATRVAPHGPVDQAGGSGYTELEWRDAVPFKSAMNMIRQMLLTPFSAEYVVVANRVEVCRSILRRLNDDSEFFSNRRWLDMQQLAWPLVANDIVPNCSLQALSQHYSLPFESGTGADGNCTALARCYWAMMRRYRAALLGEEMARELIGEPLINVAKMLF